MMNKKYFPAKKRVTLSSGQVIRIAREILGLTQAELAKKTGISPGQLSEIESDKIEIGKKRAYLFATALKLPAPYIMFPDISDYQINRAA